MNIYDVSRKAEVSIATVSRVLNGNPNVSEKTRNRVLEVMNELGYTPNIFARGLGLNTMKTTLQTFIWPMPYIFWRENCGTMDTILFSAVPE